MSLIPVAMVLEATREFKDNYLGGIRIKKGMKIYVFSNGVLRVGEFMFAHDRAGHLIDHPWTRVVEERTNVVVEEGALLDPSLYERVVVGTSVRPRAKKPAEREDFLPYRGALDANITVVGKVEDQESTTESVGPDVEQRVSLETGEPSEDARLAGSIKDEGEVQEVNAETIDQGTIEDFEQMLKESESEEPSLKVEEGMEPMPPEVEPVPSEESVSEEPAPKKKKPPVKRKKKVVRKTVKK